MVELIVQFYEVNYENASREKIRQRQNEKSTTKFLP